MPASGRFVLRIDPDLHSRLRLEAKANGISLNQLCARKLSQRGSALPGAAEAAVTRASTVVGEGLFGVVAFGSWARQDMALGSDVDLLVIVAEQVKIERDLYRAWDETPLACGGHPLEPHFVHLPASGARMSGLWAEVAVDGVVLFDHEMRVSRRLAEFRREIASGRVFRRYSQGQSYWVGIA